MRHAARCAALASSLALAAILAPPSGAQAQEQIVVTASRLAEKLGAASSSAYVIPHVGLRRRADYLIRPLTVSCDTREFGARADELRRTLRGMLAQADRDQAIELSRYVQIDAEAYDESGSIVVPFTEEEIAAPLLEGYLGRSDTSYVTLLIKTPISGADTLGSAVGRIQKFVEGVQRVGRSELDLDETDALSVVDPAQYRPQIFAAMSEDANARIAALGDGYAARFEGLENKVSWYRSDVLDLTLFIPHRLAIVPDAE